MEAERKKFYKKLISNCIFLIPKNVFHYLLAKFFLPNPNACNLQPAVSNFAAHGHDRVACAILAHAASRVTFYGYFESTSTKQYTVQTFSGAKDCLCNIGTRSKPCDVLWLF